MNVLLVDEDYPEVSSLLSQIEDMDCRARRHQTFSEAFQALANAQHRFELLVIDITLPWGELVSDEIVEEFHWKQAGLWLVRLIRQCTLDGIEKFSGLPTLPDYLANTPILALARVEAGVDDELAGDRDTTLANKTSPCVEDALKSAVEAARASRDKTRDD